MSKRDAGAAVGDYPSQGFLPGAVVNFIALLGWNPKTDEEIFTMGELAERFSLENVNRAPGRVDFEKCKWVNQQHLSKMELDDFAAASRPFVVDAGLPISENYSAVIAAVKDKVRLLSEVPKAVDFLLKDDFSFEQEALAKAVGNSAFTNSLDAIVGSFESMNEWSAAAAKTALGEIAQSAGAKPGQWMFPLRVVLSGCAHGPDIGEILTLLGRERCALRLRRFIELCDNK
jgi:glutamyl-tRNA synthetase